MQVVGLAALRRNAMNINAAQGRQGIRMESDAGLLYDFAAGCIPDRGIFRLHVAARQEPAVQPAMVHQQNAPPICGEHQARARDVARREVISGEGRRRRLQEHEDQFEALESLAVGEV